MSKENEVSNRLKWSLEGSNLTVQFPDKGISAFQLTDFFKGWSEMNSLEQYISAYGLKQKLADTIAYKKDERPSDELLRKEIEGVFKELTEGTYQLSKRGQGGLNTVKSKLENADKVLSPADHAKMLELMRQLGINLNA